MWISGVNGILSTRVYAKVVNKWNACIMWVVPSVCSELGWLGSTPIH